MAELEAVYNWSTDNNVKNWSMNEIQKIEKEFRTITGTIPDNKKVKEKINEYLESFKQSEID